MANGLRLGGLHGFRSRLWFAFAIVIESRCFRDGIGLSPWSPLLSPGVEPGSQTKPKNIRGTPPNPFERPDT
jgi:hypothetical protein